MQDHGIGPGRYVREVLDPEVGRMMVAQRSLAEEGQEKDYLRADAVFGCVALLGAASLGALAIRVLETKKGRSPLREEQGPGPTWCGRETEGRYKAKNMVPLPHFMMAKDVLRCLADLGNF